MLTVLETPHGLLGGETLAGYTYPGGWQVGFVPAKLVADSLCDFPIAGAGSFWATAGGRALLQAVPPPAAGAANPAKDQPDRLMLVFRVDSRRRPLAACRPMLDRIQLIDKASREHVDPYADPASACQHINHLIGLMARVPRAQLRMSLIGDVILNHPHYLGRQDRHGFPGVLMEACRRRAGIMIRRSTTRLDYEQVTQYLFGESFRLASQRFRRATDWRYDPDLSEYSAYLYGAVRGDVSNAGRKYLRELNTYTLQATRGDTFPAGQVVASNLCDAPAAHAELSERLINQGDIKSREALRDATHGDPGTDLSR